MHSSKEKSRSNAYSSLLSEAYKGRPSIREWGGLWHLLPQNRPWQEREMRNPGIVYSLFRTASYFAAEPLEVCPILVLSLEKDKIRMRSKRGETKVL